MAIDEATVLRIAKLARIRVPEADVPGLARELDRIIGWVEQLAEVDTSDVPPMTNVTNVAGAGAGRRPLREDDVTDGNISDDLLANAPDAEGPFFTVPKVVE